MATERIDIVVSERGSRVVKRNLEDIGSGAQKAEGGVRLLKNALSGLAAGLGINQLIKLADTYTNIQNKLRTVTTGTGQLAAVTDELFGIANRTRQSFEGTATVYTRLSSAAKGLGLSQQQTLDFTESLNQAVALSGATSVEAENALIQLSQGLGAGALRGEELNSVLEQLPKVADIIAQELGVTRGELKQLGQDGKITADVVFQAFQKAKGTLGQEFAGSVATVGQAFTVLRNNFLQTVGEFDTANGISQRLAQALVFVANNLGTIIRVAGAAAIVLGVTFAQRAMTAAINAVRAFTLALAANPLGALAIAITTVAALLITFADKIKLGGDSLATLQDLALAVWENIKAGLGQLIDFFSNNFGFIADFARDTFGDVDVSFVGILKTAAKVVDRIIGLFVGAFKAIVAAFSNLPAAFVDIFTRALNGAISLVERGVNKIIGALNKVTESVGAGSIGGVSLGRINNAAEGGAKQLGATVRQGFLDGFNQSTVQDALTGVLNRAEDIAKKRIAEENKRKLAAEKEKAALALPSTGGAGNLKGGGLGAAGGKTSNAAPKTAEANAGASFNEILQQLQQESQLLQLSNRDREVRYQLLNAEYQLQRALTPEEKQQLETQIRTNQALSEQAAIMDEINGPAEDYKTKLSALNALLEAGKISLQQYTQKLSEVRIAYLDTQTDLASGAERAFLKIAQEAGDAASQIEGAIRNAFSKAEDVFVEFTKTGKLNFKDLANSIVEDLTRIAFRQLIIAPIAGALGGAFGGGGAAGLPGFANGGEFQVGGTGGTDSQLVAFRASPNETVSVTKPGQKTGGGDTIVINVQAQDAASFQRSGNQMLGQFAQNLARVKKRNT